MTKEEIRLSPMTKAPTPTEKSKKQRDNTKTPSKLEVPRDVYTTGDVNKKTKTPL